MIQVLNNKSTQMGWSTYIEICCVCVITRLKHRDRTHVVTRCFFFLPQLIHSLLFFRLFFFVLWGEKENHALTPNAHSFVSLSAHLLFVSFQ